MYVRAYTTMGKRAYVRQMLNSDFGRSLRTSQERYCPAKKVTFIQQGIGMVLAR